ncbi:metallophosphoesterase family protein [Verrucomicrobium sp. GAS474]|uniref:metallophosphoesterase family protein n=1 Tax=Verrucomicrobium sp. GAS474 TaxID=1882831 RepID=UPI000B8A323B|nr:metallophosphoesterase family protein [Verrucomicrobium sp. GAS474]
MEATPDTYRIGLIADTHGRFHPKIPALFAPVDEIWHLGDVCEEAILDELRQINPNLLVVRGNNDWDLDAYPLTLDLERGGEAFHLVHIPPGQRTMPQGAGWVLHGHTHVPRDERNPGGRRVYNPGSAGLANKGAPLSLAILEKAPGDFFRPHLIKL